MAFQWSPSSPFFCFTPITTLPAEPLSASLVQFMDPRLTGSPIYTQSPVSGYPGPPLWSWTTNSGTPSSRVPVQNPVSERWNAGPVNPPAPVPANDFAYLPITLQTKRPRTPIRPLMLPMTYTFHHHEYNPSRPPLSPFLGPRVPALAKPPRKRVRKRASAASQEHQVATIPKNTQSIERLLALTALMPSNPSNPSVDLSIRDSQDRSEFYRHVMKANESVKRSPIYAMRTKVATDSATSGLAAISHTPNDAKSEAIMNLKSISDCSNITAAETAEVPEGPEFDSRIAAVALGMPRAPERQSSLEPEETLVIKRCNSSQIHNREIIVSKSKEWEPLEKNGQYMCPVCRKLYKYSKHARRHMFNHSEQAYQCPRCDNEFTRKDSCMRHMRTCKVLKL